MGYFRVKLSAFFLQYVDGVRIEQKITRDILSLLLEKFLMFASLKIAIILGKEILLETGKIVTDVLSIQFIPTLVQIETS